MDKIIITASEICEFLTANYPDVFKNKGEIKITPFVQGYMNFVFKIEAGGEKGGRINGIPNEIDCTICDLWEKDLKYGMSFVGIIYNANRYQGEEMRRRIPDCYKIAKYLNTNGIPCRIPIENKKGEDLSVFQFKDKERLFGLYNYLKGETLPWEAYTRRHLRSLGLVMQKIHKILQNADLNDLQIPKWEDYFENDFSNLMNYFTVNSSVIFRKLKIRISKTAVEKLYEELSKIRSDHQIIHNDLVRGNVLFSTKKQAETYPITGILDFEKTIYAPKIADIARTLAFLLIDCKYKDDAQICEHFLHRGYGKVRMENINSFLLYYWLRDFWKFLSCNPYEDLKLNFHYNETVKRLVNEGILYKNTGERKTT